MYDRRRELADDQNSIVNSVVMTVAPPLEPMFARFAGCRMSLVRNQANFRGRRCEVFVETYKRDYVRVTPISDKR